MLYNIVSAAESGRWRTDCITATADGQSKPTNSVANTVDRDSAGPDGFTNTIDRDAAGPDHAVDYRAVEHNSIHHDNNATEHNTDSPGFNTGFLDRLHTDAECKWNDHYAGNKPELFPHNDDQCAAGLWIDTVSDVDTATDAECESKSAEAIEVNLKPRSPYMAGKNTAVFGIFSHMPNLESALNELRQAGFRHEDISVLFPENLGSKELTTVKATKAPEGVAAGAGSGAVVGGALGWLVGIGALAIPGIGPFIAAGPIVAALAGLGAGGAVGGVAGGLVGLGIPEYEARRYEGRVTKGGILLSVHCDDSKWQKLAKQILDRSGAQDVSSTGEGTADYDISDRPRPATGTYGR